MKWYDFIPAFNFAYALGEDYNVPFWRWRFMFWWNVAWWVVSWGEIVWASVV